MKPRLIFVALDATLTLMSRPRNSPLRAWREKQTDANGVPLSLADVAPRFGVHRGTLHRWETGATLMGAKRAVEIAKITGLSLSDLRPDLWKRPRR